MACKIVNVCAQSDIQSEMTSAFIDIIHALAAWLMVDTTLKAPLDVDGTTDRNIIAFGTPGSKV